VDGCGADDKHKVSGVWRHSGAASSIPCDYKYVGGEYVESKGLFAGAGGSMRPTNRTGDDPMEAYYRRKSKVTAKSSGYGARWRRGSDGSEGGEGISGAEEWEEGEEEEEEQEEGSDVDGESESEDSGDGSGSDDESVSQEDEDDEATDWWVGGVAPAKNSGFALLGREQCQTNATRRLNHQVQRHPLPCPPLSAPHLASPVAGAVMHHAAAALSSLDRAAFSMLCVGVCTPVP
jgi:hypothetical protein